METRKAYPSDEAGKQSAVSMWSPEGMKPVQEFPQDTMPTSVLSETCCPPTTGMTRRKQGLGLGSLPPTETQTLRLDLMGKHSRLKERFRGTDTDSMQSKVQLPAP